MRNQGFSYKEISKELGVAVSTVSRYSQGIFLNEKAQDRLKSRRFHSHINAIEKWRLSTELAKKKVGEISERDLLIILACLHWGEGSKRELSFINSDPEMVRVYVRGLRLLGVSKSQINYTLRSYRGHNDADLINFWSKTLSIDKSDILKIHHIEGNKVGKLKYGMCRVRVRKGAPYFKLIMSMVEFIKHS